MNQFLVLFALLGGISSAVARGDEGDSAILLKAGQTEGVTGAGAALLLAALPPAKNIDAPGSADPAALEAAFRALTIALPGGAAAELRCASAEWVWKGSGRVGQYVLVPATPSCSLVAVEKAEAVVGVTLSAALADAQRANTLKGPVVPGPKPTPCHTRVCGPN